MRTLAPNGVAARLVLAMLPTAGILYANVGPVIVSGLARRAGFTAETAGYVLSADMYGSALGGFLIIFLVERVRWRPAAAVLLLLVIAADLLSAWSDGASLLMAVRFLHGMAGGALIGVAASVIARTEGPERTFGFLLAMQLLLGGIGVMLLTPLLDTVGVTLVWLSLAVFGLCTLALLPLLDSYPARTASNIPDAGATGPGRAPMFIIVSALAALFVYQAGEMAAFAYMIELGLHYALTAEFVSLAIAISLWLGGPAALLVAWWSTRSGRLLPACGGLVLSTLVVSLLFVATPTAFMLANAGFGIVFSLTLPYLLGLASELDNTGRLAAVGGFVNSLGLATGPAIGAALLDDGQYVRLLAFAVTMLAAGAVLVIPAARGLDARSKYGRIDW